MAATVISQAAGKTYILVHGAGHGSWCWEKVVKVLETKGYKVKALDLPGHGNDTALLANVTLADEVKKVTDVVKTIKGKVILVGHSSGGVVISQAAELLGVEIVDKLIYVDAFLPQNGESVFSLAGKIRAGDTATSTTGKYKQEHELLIFSADKKCFKWNPDLVEQIFYHDCLPADIAFAKAQLSWQSVATIATPVHLTDKVYGTIKKYYILCTQAKDLNKSSLISSVHCEKVYNLASSHSPFFSMPEKLVDIFIDIN